MILEYSIEKEKEWEEVVRSFNDYDIYYLPNYVKAFMYHGDGEPVLIYYKNNEIRAINVVMIRDIEQDDKFMNKIPRNVYFDITTPYGYGGFLIEGHITKDSIDSLNDEYSNYCKGKGIISEFVRFHPYNKMTYKLKDIYDIEEIGKTISIKLISLEGIWNNLTSSNRNKVRKAEKSGVKIYWGQDPLLYEKFIPLYNSTMDKDSAKSYYYFSTKFYESIIKDCKFNSCVFYAIYEEKIIAMAIILYSNERMHYHLSASDSNYKHLAPTNLLLYEAACLGCLNGYHTFHLGGGLGSKEDNLYKFKSTFNRDESNVFKIGKRIFDEKKYEDLINIRKNDNFNKNEEELDRNKGTYFPLYRAENL